MSFTNKFITGLKINYDVDYEDLKDYKYCGGNMNNHLNYFKICMKGELLPNQVDMCVCGHHIEENCYITNGEKLLVLGSCCVKRFIVKKTRTCEICGESHKNRLNNRCNDCRIGRCELCSKKCNVNFKKCYDCNMSSKKVVRRLYL